MLIASNKTLDHGVQWVAGRIEHVMLRQTVNLREEQTGFQLIVGPSYVAQILPKLFENLAAPACEHRLEARQHTALHAHAVRQRPKVTMLSEQHTDRVEQRGHSEARVWFGIG